MRALLLLVLLSISSTFNLSMNSSFFNICIEDEVIEIVEIKNDFLYSLRNLNKYEFIDTLLQTNVFDSSIVNLSHSNLKRLYTSYRYDFLIQHVSDSTGFSKDFVFAYFNYEAINNDYGETGLFRNHWNPGGIKSYSGEYTLAYDDCGDEPCRFASMKSFEEGIAKWIDVLNLPRYKKCKKIVDAYDQCKCMQESGYHTDPKVSGRVSLINKYNNYGKYFQADYRNKRESA